jgi:hypothetical protein
MNAFQLRLTFEGRDDPADFLAIDRRRRETGSEWTGSPAPPVRCCREGAVRRAGRIDVEAGVVDAAAGIDTAAERTVRAKPRGDASR